MSLTNLHCSSVLCHESSLLLLEADKYITETTSSAEELPVYVSKSWQNWDPLQ